MGISVNVKCKEKIFCFFFLWALSLSNALNFSINELQEIVLSFFTPTPNYDIHQNTSVLLRISDQKVLLAFKLFNYYAITARQLYAVQIIEKKKIWIYETSFVILYAARSWYFLLLQYFECCISQTCNCALNLYVALATN